jgi:hypothetical protein
MFNTRFARRFQRLPPWAHPHNLPKGFQRQLPYVKIIIVTNHFQEGRSGAARFRPHLPQGYGSNAPNLHFLVPKQYNEGRNSWWTNRTQATGGGFPSIAVPVMG